MKKLLILFSIIMSSCSNHSPQQADAVIENIMSRTSVRAYTDQAVPDEMVQTMLKAAMAAPSAMNYQPWEFVVVNSRETLDELAEGLKYAKMLRQAPLAIVVCSHTSWERGGESFKHPYWEHDASAATENILLAAHALGLGAVWTAAYDTERATHVINTLGLPEDVWPLCVVPIGFPAEDNAPKDKWKAEKVHYNRW